MSTTPRYHGAFLRVVVIIVLLPALASADEFAEGPCTISGQVQIDDLPAHDVRTVLELSENYEPVERWVVAASPTFRFAGLRAGWYRVSAYAEGYIPDGESAWECTGHSESREVTLNLRTGDVQVTGTVTDPDGRPIPGATASIVETGEREVFDGAPDIPLDPTGTFSVTLRLGHQYALYGRAFGYHFEGLTLFFERETLAQHHYDIQLQPEVGLRGRVLDPSGRPVAAAEVHLGPMGRTAALTDTSATDGSFYLPVRDQVNMTVGARHESMVGCAEVTEFDPERGFSVEIRMEQGRTVAGIVVDASGRPVSNTLVWFRYRPCTIWGNVMSTDDGRFEVQGLPHEPVELWAEESALTQTIADPDDSEVVVIWRPAD